MGNSSLISYIKLSPNCTKKRKHTIDTITIHCTAGQCSVETLGYLFSKPERKASCNYGIGSDGRIALIVDEENRSWCSSNRENDNRAITIEVSSDNKAPYAVADDVLDSLIMLLVDICKRNNIPKLVWSVNKADRVNHRNGCNMTCHRDFANKECPGEYLYGKHGWIADQVNKRLTGNHDVFVMDKIDMTESEIFEYLVKKGLSIEGAAGLMGNIMAESGMRANNVQNSYENKVGSDVEYTSKINNRTYSKEQFCSDSCGYGLCQWTVYNRKLNLYEYADSVHQTIDSTKMQVDFLLEELNDYYRRVLNVLMISNNIKECSDIVLTQFERPRNQSEEVKNKRYQLSLDIYKKYKNNDNSKYKVPFLVRVERNDLNVRKGPGTNFSIESVCPIGVFTIIEVKDGWGKKKFGGWISLKYVTIL